MKKISLIVTVITIVFASCKQEASFTTAENGVKYMMHRESDTGFKVHYNEVAFVYMRIRNEQGQMLINQVDSLQGHALDMMVEKKEDNLKGNIFDALTLLREGDSATFALTAKQLFGPQEDPNAEYPGKLKGDDILLIDVGIQKVIPFDTLEKIRMEMKLYNDSVQRVQDSITTSITDAETEGMHQYFKGLGLSNYKTLDSGVMIAITKPGKGAKAEKGDRVTVEFDIKTLAGADVMTTAQQPKKSYTFETLGSAVTGEVYGLHDAIAQMSEGGEATIAIPFRRGFGNRPMSEDLPAYSTLVGTIKIIKVEKK